MSGRKRQPVFRILGLSVLAIFLWFSPCWIFGQELTGPYLGQTPPGGTPRIFIPDRLRSNAEWWWHGALAFTPDGTEFYMDIYVPANNQGIQTRFMERINNVWTDPQTPSFASSHMTASPSITNDGNAIHFISTRPGAYIWKTTRTQAGWSAPAAVPIPIPANLGTGWEVSATNDGSLYIRAEVVGSQNPDIHCVRCVNGEYSAPERLGDHINSSGMELGPYVDPDEDYLIFESSRSGGYGWSDLYITFKQPDGSWSPAVNMGQPVNSSAREGAPYVSPDGLYLFFHSDRHQQGDLNPYWVSAQVIEDIRPASSVEDSRGREPRRFVLNQNYPNPFNPETTISFELSMPATVSIKIYDIQGRMIRSLSDGNYWTSGSHHVVWDGLDDYGNQVGTGGYLFRLETGGISETRKLFLLK